MVIENQVCTREQGEKLESLGVTGKPLFCYCYIHSGYEEDGKLDILPTQFELAIPDLATTWVAPAFTVAEMIIMLGMYSFSHLGADDFMYGYAIDHENAFTDHLKLPLAQGLAAMLIYRLESKIEKVEQVNQRLING